jgi:hypothetical protein
VPLSEEEQKMLEEIERSFYDNDPGLARAVVTGAPVGPRAPIVVGAAGVIGGLALVVLGLSRHVAISYVGFLAMLAGSFALVGHLRHYVHEGFSAISHRLIDTSSAVAQRRQAPNRPARRRSDHPDDGHDPKR